MRAPSPRAGFTLLETAIAVGLSAAFLGVLVQVNEVSDRLTDTALTLGRIDEAASQAIQIVAEDLRWARPDTMLITTESGSDRIDLAIAEDYDGTATVWSTPITYVCEMSPADTNENGAADECQLVRIQDGRRRVLCRNVPVGGFSAVRNAGRVDLSLGIFQLGRDKVLHQLTVQSSSTFMNP